MGGPSSFPYLGKEFLKPCVIRSAGSLKFHLQKLSVALHKRMTLEQLVSSNSSVALHKRMTLEQLVSSNSFVSFMLKLCSCIGHWAWSIYEPPRCPPSPQFMLSLVFSPRPHGFSTLPASLLPWPCFSIATLPVLGSHKSSQCVLEGETEN